MSDFLDLQGAKDLNTDAIHIGAVANSVDPVTGAPIDTHVNRVGGVDYTLKGFWNALGPVVMPWTSVTGGTLTQPNQAFLHPGNGNYYAWTGTFPKVVAPGTDPTQPGSGGWIDRTDVTLRQYVLDTTTATFKNDIHGSAVENMIAGRVNGTDDAVVHRVGNVYSTGGTTWRCLIDGVAGGIIDFEAQGKVVVNDYGVGQDNTPVQNLAIINNLILSFDGRSVVIEIPSTVDYGYTRGQRDTWPNFDALSSSPDTRIIIDDYSQGLPGGTGRSGAQHRKWYFTGNEQDGQHNGDFEYVKANWHTGHFISHDGDVEKMKVANGGAGVNRRASTIYGTNGVANWRAGQGRVTDDNASEAELAQYIISANGHPDLGVTGLTTNYVINKTDGRQGWNTGLPRYAFDFVSRTGQSGANTFGFQTPDGEPTMILKGVLSELRVISKADGGFSINNAVGALLDVSSSGGGYKLRRAGAGNVQFELETATKNRKILLRDDNGTINVASLNGASNIIVISDTETQTSTVIKPITDGVTDIGSASKRFKDIYATGTVQPSDAKLKQQITDISDNECLAAMEMQLVKFKFNSDVDDNGNAARFHYGVIAQDAAAVLEKYSIPLSEFAPICVTSTEEDGEVWNVRYSELQILILEAIKRRLG